MSPVTIRCFDWDRDRQAVEELDVSCEVGSPLVTVTMGDPLCRVRNSPAYQMLVAELGSKIVGVIRGSIKTVIVGTSQATVGYILGLRVSPSHRRRGIAFLLVGAIEKWFSSNSVEFAYMATQKTNLPSINLFTNKLNYIKFRQPVILVNTVSRRPIPIPSNVTVINLSVDEATSLYNKQMRCSAEFFPLDIDSILKNNLSLGTFVACRKDESWPTAKSWAVLSVWNSCEVFKLRLGRVPWYFVALAKLSKLMESVLLPCFKIRAVPALFSVFGFYFLYGLHGEGPHAGLMMEVLCNFVHNMAVKVKDSEMIVAELGGNDELRKHVPHWKWIFSSEDLWCIKALGGEGGSQGAVPEWAKATAPPELFVDPREI
ncbi:probable N-acetyltransferase HLS1-like [Dendrobium catenatum]|uniref:N-acetyltransferase domain-containing protein n=1 Tax=Dendrobium catenatum TaxID=906689 RepID=A0A2I0WVG0_9ASPA|nr:probable N-acetyltransferase HLS1-like [Dendrobium catenatum]PKU79642.1 hypothetical protein MA16_Dca023384 [Dendrobium catenatum]